MIDAAGNLLLILGLFCCCVSVLGVFRFRDTFQRIHAAAVADTLGMLCIFLGLGLICGLSMSTVKLMLVLLFSWIARPACSHLLARLRFLEGEEPEPGREEDAK